MATGPVGPRRLILHLADLLQAAAIIHAIRANGAALMPGVHDDLLPAGN